MEENTMKTPKNYIYLSKDEQLRVIKALNKSRNRLIEQNKYTDAVDDVICKIIKAKKKKIKVI